MALELTPLFVNDVPSINSDNFNITYNEATQTIYEEGVPASSEFGTRILTKLNLDGELLLSVEFATSMPVSGNVTYNQGSIGITQIITNADGSKLYAVTESAAAGNRGISRWDTDDLVEDAHINPSTGIGTTDNAVLGVFTLDGTEYIVMTYAGRLVFVNATTMASVVDTSYSVTGGVYYVLVGEQPTSTTQAIYTITQSGTRLRLYRHIFTGAAVSSSTLIFNWLASAVDPLWPSSFSSSPQPYMPMFDISDNTILMVVGQSGGGSSTTDAYLLKVNPTTGAIIWKLAVPDNYHWSITSSNSVINGTLKFLPGAVDTAFTYPWGETDETSGVLLTIDTSDGTYTEESYSEFGRSGSNAQRAHIYNGNDDLLLVYDTEGVNGYGNGWLAFMEAEVVEGGNVGGSGMQLEPIGCVITAQPYALEVRDLNSIVELGPFRFIEQKESDETSMITTLVVGLSETDTGLTVEIDLALVTNEELADSLFGDLVDLTDVSASVDFDDLEDIIGDDLELDMGEGVGNSDDFTLHLLGNEDGSTYPGAPIEFKPEELEPIEDRGSTKQYSPLGYSFIYHRVRLSATEIDDKFSVKFVDISGQLTGRLL